MDEEGRERFGSGSSVEQGGKQVSVWSCAAGAADTQEEAEARYVGAGLPLWEQAELAARDVKVVLEESVVAMKGEVKVGKEGVGGS